MFTQCSKCETIYRLSAESLRAAGGQVRCGRCGEVFSALTRLAEDAAGFTTGESPLALESRAEEILETATSAPADESSKLPPGVEIAQLQILDPLDEDIPDDVSLEFTLPPGELDRIFVEPPATALRRLGPLPLDAAASHASHSGGSPLTAADARGDLRDAGTALPGSLGPNGPAAGDAGVGTGTDRATVAVRAGGVDSISHKLPAALRALAALDAAKAAARRPDLPFLAWLVAALVLGLLLVIQVVRGHGWSEHASASNGAATSLTVYQLRQWGVTGDPGARGILRVRASILNTAAQLKPYPLMRVSLVNRFGTRVGSRDFEPAEYLGHRPARLLAPGEQADALLDIVDPGEDAEGFEIDVCVRGSDTRVVCAAEVAAATKAAAPGETSSPTSDVAGLHPAAATR